MNVRVFAGIAAVTLTVSFTGVSAFAQTNGPAANGPSAHKAAVTVSKAEDVGMSSERLQRIHALLQRHIDGKDFSGAVSLVSRKGKVVYFEAQGMADVEAGKQMKTDSLFQVLAMTKPVTTVAILMLLEESKLTLGDPISKYIPEFKNPQVAVLNPPNDPAGSGTHLVPAAREITLQDLLTHTSGVANGFAGPAGEYVRKANLPSGGSLDERVKRLAKLPLNFQPGTQWQYSQATGYDTLGRVVEIVSGMSLEQFFQTRIFQPLGMKDTFFSVPAERSADVAVAYNKNGDKLVRRPAAAGGGGESGQYFSGALGLTTSIGDYFKFCQMLLNGGKLNGVRLLGRKTVELMTSIATGDMDLSSYPNRELQGYGIGLGMRVRRDTGETTGWEGSVGDYGWAGTLGTFFWIDPKEQLIAVYMTQTGNTLLRTEFPNVVYQAISD